MTRETRLIFLVGLTYMLYAVSMYFDKGAFILPYPMNEAVLFAVSLQFAYKNWHHRTPAIIIVLIGLFGILMNQIYWETILSFESLVTLSKSIWPRVFSLLFLISLLSFGIITVIQQRNWVNFAMFVGFLILLTIGIASPASLYFVAAYGLMTLSTQIKRVHSPLHLFWLLLLILEVSRFITEIVNGAPMI